MQMKLFFFLFAITINFVLLFIQSSEALPAPVTGQASGHSTPPPTSTNRGRLARSVNGQDSFSRSNSRGRSPSSSSPRASSEVQHINREGELLHPGVTPGHGPHGRDSFTGTPTQAKQYLDDHASHKMSYGGKNVGEGLSSAGSSIFHGVVDTFNAKAQGKSRRDTAARATGQALTGCIRAFSGACSVIHSVGLSAQAHTTDPEKLKHSANALAHYEGSKRIGMDGLP